MNRIERAKIARSRLSVELDRIYSFAETSVILGVSGPTLRGFLKAGKISAKKIGRRWFISGRALNSALDPCGKNPLNPDRPTN